MTSLPVLKLTPEEMAVITMIRRNSFQEIMIQIQDGIITSVNQILKYRRRKGGGLVSGHVAKNATASANVSVLTPEEMGVIKRIREKPFQQIVIQIKNSIIECINQTTKFRNKGGVSATDDLS